MVQFVTDARHFQPVDHFRIGGAVRVGIYGAQVIRLLDASAGIDGNRIKNFFPRRPDGIRWAGIARTTTFHFALSTLPAYCQYIIPAMRTGQ